MPWQQRPKSGATAGSRAVQGSPDLNLDDDRPWTCSRKLPQPALTPAFPTPPLATLPLFTPDLLAHLGTLHALSHLTAFTLFLFLCWKSRRRSSKPLQPLLRCQALSKRFTCNNSFNPLHNPMDINRYCFVLFLLLWGLLAGFQLL